jgi:hypothetical protein
VVGFVSLPDEHAPSVKYRVRRVLHAQRTDPMMKPPRSAPPAGVDLHLLPDWVLMVVASPKTSLVQPRPVRTGQGV